MNENIKRMFFVTTLLILLVGLSAISAADASNDTSSISQQDVVKEVNVEKVSDNIVTDTSTKNIKKEEQTTDLYVSESNGSDDNSGTNTSPYKTIQKALDTTNADSTFNIHIAEGTYKGLGNTNLTVNGNYNINFIGTGVNSTVFDGEASYEIHKQTDAGDFYWESSEIWYPYENATGNWFMNVTAGTGKISISNLTMQNGWVTGGTSIESYPYAVMDNWGNLSVDNVYFYSNHGGVGSAIRNNYDATLTVTNSIFDNNTKSSGTGNDGIIYNNGTAYLDNIQMINNLARWGSILNDHVLYVNNSLIRNNTAYDGASTYKFGAGIASNSGTADYFNVYTIEGIETYVNNVTFMDIDQLSIYQSLGKLVVNNSHFNHTTGIVLAGLKNSTDYLIENNEFYNMTGSSYFASLSSTERKIFDIYAPNNCTLTITNNTIDNNNDDSTAIQIGTDKIITNNNIKNVIEVNGNNNQITNNTITTRTGYAITLTSSSRNNIITDNYLTTRTSSGDVAVQSRRQNTIENNTPTMSEYTVTDETYNEFFDENGKLYNTNVTPGSILYLSGDFYNKNFTFDNIGLKVTTKDQTTLYNTTITVTPTAVIQLENIKIDNTNIKDNIINLEGNYNTINNITINSVSDYSLNAIKVSGNDTIITTTTITVTQNGEDTEETTGIFIESSNNQLDSININVKSESTNNITVVKIKSDNQLSDNKLNNMTVNANGNITKAFEITNADKTTIMMDTMYVAMTITGKDYVSFLEVTNSSEIIFEKTSWANYQLRSNGVGYAIILNGTADNPMKNITFTKNGGLNLYAVNNTYVYARNVNGFDFAFGQAGIGMSGNEIIGFDLENVNNTIQQDSIGYGLSFSRGSVETKAFTLINSHHNTFNGINTNSITNGYGIYLYNSTNNTFNPSQTTSSWSPLKVATITTENAAIILENSDNNLFNYTNITSTNSNAIKLINSNNNQIINCVINANEKGILLNQSNNNIITENTVKTPDDYSVELINSHDNTISYNNFQAVNTGDNSVENPEENTIYHNGPIFINLTDDNYDTYFLDGKLKDEYKSKNITVVLGSDLHEKELNFDFEEEFMKLYMTNPQNYTLYNTTFTLNTPYIITFISNYHNINGLNFYSNNEEETVININTPYLDMNNINIYHENHESNTRTAIVNAYYEYTLSDRHVMYWNIETHGPSQTTTDDKASTIAYQGYSLYYSNITVIETENNGGIITAVANVPVLEQSNINITGTNVVATENMQRSITQSNITATADNLIGFYYNNAYLDPGRVIVQVGRNNFNLEADNVTGILFEDVISSVVGNNLIYQNNITIKSNDTTPIKVDITQDNTDRFIKNIFGNKINVESDNVKLADISGIWIKINENTYNLSIQTLEAFTMHDTNINQECNISNNTITTTLDVPELIKVENSSNVQITENYLVTSTQYGDVLVNANGDNITVQNNRPNIILTDENYNEYFTNNVLNTLDLTNIVITIGSDINNKDMIFNQPVTIINNQNYIFNNMTITINPNATESKLSNLTIINNDDRESAIIIKANNTNISYTNIYQNNTNTPQKLIKINNATNIVFSSNNITTNSAESEIINAQESSFWYFQYNNIIANGENIKALLVTNEEKTYSYYIVAQDNNITITSPNPTTAIYLETNARIRNNNITIDADNGQTPIIEAFNSTLLSVQNNYIESHDLCGNDAVSGATTNTGNTPTTTGYKSIINISIDNIKQHITTNIPITITDTFGQTIEGTITATINGQQATIKNNQITITTNNTTDLTITATYTDPTGKYNTNTITKTLTVTPVTLTVDPLTATAGETINITARITANDETLTDINKGKVTFKVNGKTLKDANGKVIYAKVVNGTATIENYEVPQDWAKEGTTIQAVYSGSTDCEKLTSEKTNITVAKAVPTLTTEDITATAGDKITLKATITDNDKVINSGKIVFKINGKTVKDENGKVIYAKVVNNTVEFEYTLPESYKAGSYNITATFISADYDRLTDSKTLTVNA